MVWITAPELVFYCGAGFALLSLIASQFIPNEPKPGQETLSVSGGAVPATA